MSASPGGRPGNPYDKGEDHSTPFDDGHATVIDGTGRASLGGAQTAVPALDGVREAVAG
ncbi:hypothetical protein ABT001_03060 [Streptomyces sp. NPDC002793]|uniref:hypothetical protein n=1 Tax=Streptomyces sp. NPDC002793 TaxID=3154432 RepID=UPI00332356F9